MNYNQAQAIIDCYKATQDSELLPEYEKAQAILDDEHKKDWQNLNIDLANGGGKKRI